MWNICLSIWTTDRVKMKCLKRMLYIEWKALTYVSRLYTCRWIRFISLRTHNFQKNYYERGRENGYVICQVDCYVTVTNINPRAIKRNYRGTSSDASPSDTKQASFIHVSTKLVESVDRVKIASFYISKIFLSYNSFINIFYQPCC